MEANYSFPFESLSNELLLDIIQREEDWLLTPLDKNINEVVLQWFRSTNQNIVKQFPQLNKVYKQEENDSRPKLLFNRLVNNLHDMAKMLKCDEVPPTKNLNPEERFKWECQHYKLLMKKIEEVKKDVDFEYFVRKKEEDFEYFVKAVAKEMKVPWGRSTNANNMWDNLKNNPNLKNIKKLDLSYKKIDWVPHEILLFKDLISLNLQHNNIKNLDDFIGNLKNLKFLSLNGNELKKIPSEIFKLDKLEYLDLHYNSLEELPKEIGNLKNLEELNLINNELEKFPSTLNSTDMPKLDKLYIIGGNNLLDSEIEELKLRFPNQWLYYP